MFAQKTFCLVGNPNSGKSSIYNLLTNSFEKTGNWDGVTVDSVKKSFVIENHKINLVDLPGSTTLRNSATEDERTTLNFLNDQNYDCILNVIDATNLQMGLYLTIQLLEIGKPIIIVINKIDLLSQNQALKLKKSLLNLFSIPVILFSSFKKLGLRDLKSLMIEKLDVKYENFIKLYDESLKRNIDRIRNILVNENLRSDPFFVIKLLENSNQDNNLSPLIQQEIKKSKEGIESVFGYPTNIAIMDCRYRIARNLFLKIQPNLSLKFDKIDNILLSRKFGIIIFFIIVYLMFSITIFVGGFLSETFEDIAEYIVIEFPTIVLKTFGIENEILNILITGVGSGVKTIAEFIPVIFTLYASLSILEESGYMSRAAFVMDSLMKKIGLPGKALIPLVTGFGCNVPSMMATRALENKNDRFATILSLPFILCGAGLSVFVILTSIFFSEYQSLIILFLYFFSILFSITIIFFTYKFFNYRTRGTVSHFIVELPKYQLPKFLSTLKRSYKMLLNFISGAGKMIIITCLVFHILSSFSIRGNIVEDISQSILVNIGKNLTSYLRPIGIKEDNWPASVSLLSGLLAKEVLMGTMYSLVEKIAEEEENPSMTIKRLFESQINVFSYMLFILLYFPCVSVFAVIMREINLKWAIISGIGSTAIAYFFASCINSIGIALI